MGTGAVGAAGAVLAAGAVATHAALGAGVDGLATTGGLGVHIGSMIKRASAGICLISVVYCQLTDRLWLMGGVR